MIFVGFAWLCSVCCCFIRLICFAMWRNGQSHRTAQKKREGKTRRGKTKNHNTQKPERNFFLPAGFVLADEWCSHGIFMILLGFLSSIFFGRVFFTSSLTAFLPPVTDFAESLTISLREKRIFFVENGFVAAFGYRTQKILGISAGKSADTFAIFSAVTQMFIFHWVYVKCRFSQQ